MKLRLLLALLTVFLSTSSWAAKSRPNLRVLDKSDHALTLELTFSRPQIISTKLEDQFFQKVIIDGLATFGEPGQAELPVDHVVLPTLNESVSVDLVEAVAEEIEVGRVVPFQAAEPRAEGEPPLEIDRGFYGTNAFTPGRAYDLRHQGKFRYHELYSLVVYPCQYNPATAKLKFYKKLIFSINYHPGTQAVSIGNIPLKERHLLEALTHPDLIRTAPGGSRRQMESTWPDLQSIQAAGRQVKMFVEEDGFYSVSYEDLDTLEIDLRSVVPQNIKVHNKGREIPIRIVGGEDGRFDPGDAIEFWGEFNKKTFIDVADDLYRDPYQDANVYWLSWGEGAGRRMAEEDGSIVETDPNRFIRPFFYEFTVHQELDRHFDRLSEVSPEQVRDHWFYDNGVSAGEKREYEVFLPHPDKQALRPTSVKVMLHGLTFLERDHEVSVFLNSRKLFEGRWRGQEKFSLQTVPGQGIPQSALNHGTNTLTIINEVPSAELDNILLNWFEVSYQRLYRAHEDEILFGIPRDGALGLYDFRISGFSSPNMEIFKLGASQIIGAEVTRVRDATGEESYQAHFQDEVFSEDIKYVAVTPGAKRKPAGFLKDEPSTLRAPSNGADYIIIAPEVFRDHPALLELRDLRASQGLRSMLVWDQDVYDEFNHGLRSPHAIRKFLRYAFENWQPPAPLFVLLAGDGSVDNKDIMGHGGNLLPVYLFQASQWGATASDHWYSRISGEDQISDIIVGRFPVRSEEALEAVVRKTIEYEQSAGLGSWRNSLLFIGGNRDDFRTQSESLIRGAVPERFDPRRLYTLRNRNADFDPYFGGTSTLINLFDSGLGFINFMGHGGGAIWSDNSLFRLEDVNRLSNQGLYPIITSMTCFAGAFDEPARSSISEVLLGTPDRGAVALWASSGLGWSQNDFLIVREFFDTFLSSETRRPTLGENIIKAKLDYFTKFGSLGIFRPISLSMINQYNILGDPALRPILPQEEVELEVETSVPEPGSSVRVVGSSPISTGTAEVALLNRSRDIVSTTTVPVSSGSFELEVPIPTNIGGEAYIRAYVFNEAERVDANGAVSLSLSAPVFRDLKTLPEAPGPEDSVRFSVEIAHRTPITEAHVFFLKPADQDSLPLAHGSGTLWQTEQAIPVTIPAGEALVFRVHVVAQDGAAFISTVKVTRVVRGVDLRVAPRNIRLTGTGVVILQSQVENTGDAAAEDVEVVFYRRKDATEAWQLVGRDSVTVPPGDTTTAAVPVYPGAGAMAFQVRVDPENRLGDADVTNNTAATTLEVTRFNLDPNLGTTLFGAANDTIHTEAGVSFYVPPNAVGTNRVLLLETVQQPAVFNQPDFSFIPADDRVRAYRLTAGSGTNGALLNHPCWVAVKFDRSDSLASFIDELGLFRLDPTTRKWIRQESRLQGERHLAGLVSELGTFAVMRGADSKPPRLEVKVEGQLFAQNSFVQKDPVITAVAQDENGIDITPERIEFFIDNQPFPLEQVTFPDSLRDANVYTMILRPSLSAGLHTFNFRVFDANGNVSLPEELTFKIAENADVRVLGTYPNPFQRRTVFAYELTDRAEDLQLKIYTSSGRLIRTFGVTDILDDPSPLSPDYHEITWDGTDDVGDEVANGLYFYKLRVAFDNKSVEKVGKVARIR